MTTPPETISAPYLVRFPHVAAVFVDIQNREAGLAPIEQWLEENVPPRYYEINGHGDHVIYSEETDEVFDPWSESVLYFVVFSRTEDYVLFKLKFA